MFQSLFGRAGVQGAFGRRSDAGFSRPAPQLDAATALIARLDPHFPDYAKYLALPTERQHQIDFAFHRAAQAAIVEADQAQRSALIIAIAESGKLASFTHARVATAEKLQVWRFHALLDILHKSRGDTGHGPAMFRAIARLLGDTPVWGSSLYASEPWQKRLKAMCDAGHRPSPEEKAWLAGFKAQIAQEREKRQRHGGRDELRRIDAMIRWIDKVCDTEPGDSGLVERMTTPTIPAGRFPDPQPNFAFWVDFIIAAAGALEQLLGELEADPDPAWLHEEAAYAERFPPAGALSRPFGWWNAEEKGAEFGGAPLRGINWALSRRQRPARAADYRDCLDAPERLPTLNHVWSSDYLPGVTELADPSDPADAEWLIHLAGAKAGMRPQASWLAKARKLIARDGKDRARARLAGWMEHFAGAAPDAENYARLQNYATLVTAAAWLQSKHPDLPGCEDPAAVTRAARALALHAGGRYLDQGFLFCDANGWLGRVTGLQAAEIGAVSTPGRDRWKPGLGNEAVLRGVAWLFGDFPEPEIVDLLERVVASAMAYGQSYQGARSRSTANAAIASLARIGTPEAAEALGRIRRSVRDKAVANSVAKAIAGLAGARGVSSADIEEMSMPSYGFE